MFAILFIFSISAITMLSLISLFLFQKEKQNILNYIKEKMTMKNVLLGLPLVGFLLWTIYVGIHGWFVGGTLFDIHPLHTIVLLGFSFIIGIMGVAKALNNESFRKISVHFLMALIAIGVIVFSRHIVSFAEWLAK